MKVSPSCAYFSAGQKPPGFSCRSFNHISPLSLPLYLTVAGVCFCRKQAEHFTATNVPNASARSQLRAQCQDCVTQAADMHMAPNHAGSLAGFKSLGETKFYAPYCSIPAPSSVPMHTQRQDPWHTCSSSF